MAHSVVSTALTMNVADLVKGVNTAVASLKKLEGGASSTGSKLNAAFKKLSGAANLQNIVNYGRIAKASYQAATSATYGFITAQLKFVKTNFDVAYSLGLTYNQLQALSLAAQQAGLGLERLYEPMSKVARKVDDALRGMDTSVQNFARLKLDPGELSKLNAYDQFKVVADALNAIPNAAERSALAMNIFEESGAKFLQLFSAGSKGLEEFEQEAAKLGLTLNKMDLGKLLQANEAVIRMQNAWTGLKTTVLTQVAPLVTRIAEFMTDFFSDKDFAKKIGDVFASVIKGLAGLLANVVEAAAGIIALIERTFGKLEVLIDETSKMLNGWRDAKNKWDIFNAEFEKNLWGRAADDAVIARGMAAEQDLGRLRPGQAGYGTDGAATRIGDSLRAGIKAFEDGVIQPLSENVQRMLADPLQGERALQGPAAAAAAAAQVVATKELTVATNKNSDALGKVASADDFRTSSGMAAWLKAMAPGYGENKEVTLLEKIVEHTRKMANQQPIPANI